LFRLPGAGGFALISGMVSGYPMGVKITARLLERGELTRMQAQRLLGFVNNCGPLFVIGAVGAGMFGSARTGYFILGAHYFSAVLTGVILSLFAGKEGVTEKRWEGSSSEQPREDSRPGRPFGEILGAGVQDAMASILKVGGFIIIFSVLVRSADMLRLSGLARGAVTGFLEMTNGVRAVAGDGSIDLRIRVAAAAGIVSFGGLSVHAQSAAFLQGSGLRVRWYYTGKAVQTALSVFLAAAVFPVMGVCPAGSAEGKEVFAVFLTGGGFLRNLCVSLAGTTAFAAAVLLVRLFAGGGRRTARTRR
ncbi:MAG: hypothetical protein FWC55_04610, partial [Firmicutes bacterium]|nr:hypothetical protein [Bacillota bacterium]